MKTRFKLLLVLLSVITLSGIAYAHDDVPVAYNELPQKAKAFIVKHFGDSPRIHEIEYDEPEGVYSVDMQNGYDIKFNKAGNVIEVDSPDIKDLTIAIVKDLLPPNAISYLKNADFLDDVDDIKVLRKGGFIVDIDKMMSSDVTLHFDSKGNLVKRVK